MSRYCNGCGTKTNDLEWDHIIPISRGGADDPLNFQLLCVPCNSAKGMWTMREWVKLPGSRGANYWAGRTDEPPLGILIEGLTVPIRLAKRRTIMPRLERLLGEERLRRKRGPSQSKLINELKEQLAAQSKPVRRYRSSKVENPLYKSSAKNWEITRLDGKLIVAWPELGIRRTVLLQPHRHDPLEATDRTED